MQKSHFAQSDGGTCSNFLGEPLGEYHKLETLKTLNIYILAYQAIIRSCAEKYRIFWGVFYEGGGDK